MKITIRPTGRNVQSSSIFIVDSSNKLVYPYVIMCASGYFCAIYHKIAIKSQQYVVGAGGHLKTKPNGNTPLTKLILYFLVIYDQEMMVML